MRSKLRSLEIEVGNKQLTIPVGGTITAQMPVDVDAGGPSGRVRLGGYFTLVGVWDGKVLRFRES